MLTIFIYSMQCVYKKYQRIQKTLRHINVWIFHLFPFAITAASLDKNLIKNLPIYKLILTNIIRAAHEINLKHHFLAFMLHF